MKSDELIDKIFQLCFQGEFEDAKLKLKSLRAEYGFIERAIHIELCVYSLTSNIDSAKELIQTLLNQDIWLNPFELETDGDLERLRELPEFKALLKSSKNHYSQQQEKKTMKIFQLNRESEEETVFCWIHGRGTNFNEFQQDYNRMKLLVGYRQVYIQSSQVYAGEKFCWDNEECAVQEIREALKTVTASRKMICGISQGGRVLLNALLQDKIDGDILMIIPAITKSEIEKIRTSDAAFSGTLRIITGSLDSCYENVCTAAELLQGRGFRVELFSMEGVGHYLPEYFNDVLEQILAK